MADKLYPVVYDLLVSCGYSKTAAKCLKEINKTESALKTSESLLKIYEAYLKKTKVAAVVAKKEESSDDDSSDDEESDEEEKKVVAVATKKIVAPAPVAKVLNV